LGAQLRLWRERAGLSQEALAARAGLGVATLKALERDQRRRPHPQTLALLAESLGLALEERASLLAVPGASAPGPAAIPTPRSDSPTDPTGRLPVPPTPLIGRAAEVAEIGRLFSPAQAAIAIPQCVPTHGAMHYGWPRLAREQRAATTNAQADLHRRLRDSRRPARAGLRAVLSC
jgi:transcriptional regulator with XRE-family HTH domain